MMHENMFRVESAVSATSSGNLTWEQWPHDIATALGMAGSRNPLGFAVVRYLSDAPSGTNAMGVVMHLATALIRQNGYDQVTANDAAWKALEAWNNIKCPGCFGRGVVSADQRVCGQCNGTGERDVNLFPMAVKDGISALMDAERWMEGQLSARMKRCGG